MAALALLGVLLRRLGAVPTAVTVAVATVAASPMIQVYGGMLNHEAVVLPLTLAATIAWWGAGRPRTGVTVALVLVGSLISFHMVAFGACRLVVDVLGRRVTALDTGSDRRAPSAGELRQLALGIAGAVVVLVVWLTWAGGGLAEVLDQTGTRTSASMGLPSSVARQWLFLRLTVPVAAVALAVAGLVIATRSRVPRLAAIATTWSAYVAGYALLLPGGSTVHVFWNFAVVVPIALGVAALVSAVPGRTARALVGTVLSVALVTAGLAGTSAPEQEFDDGLAGLTVLAAVPAGQTSLPVWPAIAGWTGAEWATGVDVVLVGDDALTNLAASDPGAVVLVPRDGVSARHPELSWDEVVERATSSAGDYAVGTAADLAPLAGGG